MNHSQQAECRLPTLLPAPPRSRRPPVSLQPKRPRTFVACNECRARKTKCNGERPKCSACISNTSVCQYEETQNHQAKKRAQASDKLLEMMKSLPETDAIEVFRRVRAGVDPRIIINQARDGNLLMQFSLIT
ncbi:hypothetical protein B0J11DRAFT_239907 [Dendryphion nanum]|uniref:Zn(2)-C6 fungal-type domain-containing protein n=1 Tax=Dendryphion nanum TaxID=256645 RepID=A0A9P9CXT3_9PLEO|nr:hypothetical protein B0J11DRAFT_239907 [Dendryphion nanum]